MTINTVKPIPFDIVAFVAALIAAPLLVTFFTCYLFVPIAALIIGGPVYLVIGTPILLWMVGRYPPTFWWFALAGFLANAALCVMLVAATKVLPAGQNIVSGDMIYMAYWGLLFAPIWAGTFAPLYRNWNR
jgi:hypothetical protein